MLLIKDISQNSCTSFCETLSISLHTLQTTATAEMPEPVSYTAYYYQFHALFRTYLTFPRLQQQANDHDNERLDMAAAYVSPIVWRCCPISLMMSLSVRDISLTVDEGSHVPWSPFMRKDPSVPFVVCPESPPRLMSVPKRRPAVEIVDDGLRLTALLVDCGACISADKRSFFEGGGGKDGPPSTSLSSDDEARLAVRPATGRWARIGGCYSVLTQNVSRSTADADTAVAHR